MIFGKATKNIERDQKSDLGLTLVTGNDDYLPETSHPTPQICIVDFSEEAIKVLDKHRFSYDSVSLHSRVNIPSIQKRYDQELFLPKSNFPDNFHEFDMTFVDLTKNTNVSYDYEDHYCEVKNHHTSYGVICTFPKDIINLKPYELIRLNKHISEVNSKKQSVVVVFCGEIITESYNFIKMSSDGWSKNGSGSVNTFQFYNEAPTFHCKSGIKVKTYEHSPLRELTNKFEGQFTYRNIFEHPTIYDQHSNKYLPAENFIPLLVNGNDEIIAYIHYVKNTSVIVFPDLENKAEFVELLLTVNLPELYPTLFPSHGMFGWLNNGDYLLPTEKELNAKKVDLHDQYIKSITQLDLQLQNVREEYNFLHQLLSETGDNLVLAIKLFLEWLGFEDVIDMDEKAGEVYEEDLQIENKKGLLIIEIKGIGGTSTDKACSQISKIKFRRAQQRNAFDVYALYIVNHQRYIAPTERQNPPFSENQINDAVLDQRGLLTTYDLYNAYFQIENGVLNKTDVREQLYNTGLICFEPNNLVFIAKPDRNDYYKKNTVVILQLSPDISLNVGDKLSVLKNTQYTTIKIVSLEINSLTVNEACGCEVGVLLEQAVEKNSEFYLIDNIPSICNET